MNINSIKISKETGLDHKKVIDLIKKGGFKYSKITYYDVPEDQAEAIISSINHNYNITYYDFMYNKLMDFKVSIKKESRSVINWIRLYKEYPEKTFIPKELLNFGIKVGKSVDIAKSFKGITINVFDGDSDYGRSLSKCSRVVKDAPATGRFKGVVKGLVRVEI